MPATASVAAAELAGPGFLPNPGFRNCHTVMSAEIIPRPVAVIAPTGVNSQAPAALSASMTRAAKPSSTVSPETSKGERSMTL